MIRHAIGSVVLLSVLCFRLAGASAEFSLAQRPWFETRSAHFTIYSCVPQPDVRALATHLEQFCEVYSRLAGAQAVASPIITVVAFPDHDSMKPFLPLYQGKPGNISGFFKRDEAGNLIVMALAGTNSAFAQMSIIFHEYAHVLFRHNVRIWPVWLSEGMADIYSTFDSSGNTVRIGQPIEPYLQLLKRPMMPLKELFAITRESPQYNEGERQGMFYAQSWLLAHYLMSGGLPAYKTRFGQFTRRLREGETPERAFVNAMGISLPVMEVELRRYLAAGTFPLLQWPAPANLGSAKAMSVRVLAPAEVYFRLGHELLRIERLDAAEAWFSQAQKVAPSSPLTSEGLGLLAAARERHQEAIRKLNEALQRGSVSFLTHYVYAREKFALTSRGNETYSRLQDETAAAEIRGELQKAIALMPGFGPAHQLLGFFEMVQGDNLAEAKQQLTLAVQLEPDNPAYLFSLAQAQWQNHEPAAARKTLEPLLRPTTEEKIRQTAEELLKKVDGNVR